MRQNYEQKLIFGEDASSSGKRMAAVKLMLDQNIETLTIASIVGVSERQVFNYKRQIKAGGDIYADRHYRPVSDMVAVDAEIVKSLKEQPVATAREAAKRIEQVTGLKRSNTQIRKFMHKHGLKPLKTASLPAKMDPAAQRKFLEEELEPRLARAKGESNEVKAAIMENPMETEAPAVVTGPDIETVDSLYIVEKPKAMDNGLKDPVVTDITVTDDNNKGKGINGIATVQSPDKPQESVVLFMDAVHCVWQAVLGILWSVERIFIPAASGRKRVNVLGAYDPVANKLLKIITRTYINSLTVCDMLSQIAAAYIGKFITVVLDNASYQHCDLVINTAKALGIELLFLPTYSPNLNLIERLWKFLKSECLKNEFYNTSREFESAITSCLDKINTEHAVEVKRLMSMKFHLYDTFDEHPTYFGKNKKGKAAA